MRELLRAAHIETLMMSGATFVKSSNPYAKKLDARCSPWERGGRRGGGGGGHMRQTSSTSSKTEALRTPKTTKPETRNLKP